MAHPREAEIERALNETADALDVAHETLRIWEHFPRGRRPNPAAAVEEEVRRAVRPLTVARGLTWPYAGDKFTVLDVEEWAWEQDEARRILREAIPLEKIVDAVRPPPERAEMRYDMLTFGDEPAILRFAAPLVIKQLGAERATNAAIDGVLTALNDIRSQFRLPDGRAGETMRTAADAIYDAWDADSEAVNSLDQFGLGAMGMDPDVGLHATKLEVLPPLSNMTLFYVRSTLERFRVFSGALAAYIAEEKVDVPPPDEIVIIPKRIFWPTWWPASEDGTQQQVVYWQMTRPRGRTARGETAEDRKLLPWPTFPAATVLQEVETLVFDSGYNARVLHDAIGAIVDATRFCRETLRRLSPAAEKEAERKIPSPGEIAAAEG